MGKKIFAIIAALLTGGIGIAVFSASQAAQAGVVMN
jgi:hypothetical protein